MAMIIGIIWSVSLWIITPPPKSVPSHLFHNLSIENVSTEKDHVVVDLPPAGKE